MSNRLPFRSKFDGGICPVCEQEILTGQQIQFNDSDVLEHKDCELPGAMEPYHSPYMLDVVDGISMHDNEGAVLTLQRPACGKCFLELPTSLVCGNCG